MAPAPETHIFCIQCERTEMKTRHPHFILGLNSEEWEVKHDQHHVDLELSPTYSVTFSLCEWFVLIWL